MIANLVAGFIGASTAAATDYESIATVTVGAGGASSVDFTSIAGTYKHLQVRGISRSSTAISGTFDMWMRFNSDSGTNYTFHALQGDGAAASASGATAQARVRLFNAIPGASSTANTFGVLITDILDYSNTNKNKTVRSLYGANDNTTNTEYRSIFHSSLWSNTAAITSITLLPESGNFAQYSSFALYGIK